MAAGQDSSAPPGDFDADARRALLNSVAATVRAEYVNEHDAHRIADEILERAGADAYPEQDKATFARQVSKDLALLAQDPHLRLAYSPEPKPPHEGRGRTEIDESQTLAEYRSLNYGFESARILPGNIGVLAIRMLLPPKWAGDTMAAAMAFVADCSALILDLRNNHGGASDMVAMLLTYLFAEPVELCGLQARRQPIPTPGWTLPWVPGRRLTSTPTYVLQSRQTSSAAESVAYDLRRTGRAQIVGEPSAGAAHAIEPHRLDMHFRVVIPFGRACAPITGENWHRVGVPPHVECSADEALERAKDLARKL